MIISALMRYQEIIIICKLQWMLRSSPMAQWIKNPLTVQELQKTWVRTLDPEDPLLEYVIATHSSILA